MQRERFYDEQHDECYTRVDGWRDVALVGDWCVADSPAGRRYSQTDQKIIQRSALLRHEL